MKAKCHRAGIVYRGLVKDTTAAVCDHHESLAAPGEKLAVRQESNSTRRVDRRVKALNVKVSTLHCNRCGRSTVRGEDTFVPCIQDCSEDRFPRVADRRIPKGPELTVRRDQGRGRTAAASVNALDTRSQRREEGYRSRRIHRGRVAKGSNVATRCDNCPHRATAADEDPVTELGSGIENAPEGHGAACVNRQATSEGDKVASRRAWEGPISRGDCGKTSTTARVDALAAVVQAGVESDCSGSVNYRRRVDGAEVGERARCIRNVGEVVRRGLARAAERHTHSRDEQRSADPLPQQKKGNGTKPNSRVHDLCHHIWVVIYFRSPVQARSPDDLRSRRTTPSSATAEGWRDCCAVGSAGSSRHDGPEQFAGAHGSASFVWVRKDRVYKTVIEARVKARMGTTYNLGSRKMEKEARGK